jgi:hypothetical protein
MGMAYCMTKIGQRSNEKGIVLMFTARWSRRFSIVCKFAGALFHLNYTQCFLGGRGPTLIISQTLSGFVSWTSFYDDDMPPFPLKLFENSF